MSHKMKTYIEQTFSEQIRSHEALPKTTGTYADFPPDLNPLLTQTLREKQILSLYSHQREAYDSITAGKNTVIVSQTASGKTLSFLLPILNQHIAAKNPFSTLFLYPTKALSRDQEGNLASLLDTANLERKLGTFDGDTPKEERAKMMRNADFIMSNPDMLHGGILPNHNRKWKDFISRLKYIVIDEVHTYRGAYGSHVANIFRRLLRVCEIHGSEPIFICSSATIGNPKEHVEKLFNQAFTVIDQDGSPRPKRDLYLLNPSMARTHGGSLYRKGPGSASIPLLVEACKQGVRTICFCRGRQEVERLYKAVLDRDPSLKDVIKPYRGGLLPNERRQLEQDLFSGKLKAIISTNALELGIDIGDLDLCILSGHPGTVASFWQQAGRVGRKNNNAIIAYIAKESPVDQYLVHHSDFITSAPAEQAWLNANNPYILLQHLPCAAYEHPFREEEPAFPNVLFNQSIEVLKEDGSLKPYKTFLRYSRDDYPAKGVNIRGMTDYNIEIYCGTEVIGEIDPIGARGELYKDAIYMHLGKRYMSMDLDLEKKLCRVERVDVDYYTEAHWERSVSLEDEFDQQFVHGHKLTFGFINAKKQPKLYKKIREKTFENIGAGPITLAPFEYDTTGFCIQPNPTWMREVQAVDRRFVGAGLYGLASIMRKVCPSVCMASTGDIETDVSLTDKDETEWKSSLYLFDSIDGGVGYGEKIYENLDTALKLCLDIINECECEAGCPSCVPTMPPGAEGEEMSSLLIESNASRECTKSLLLDLLYGETYLPQVSIIKKPLNNQIEPPPADLEFLMNQKRLSSAALIMKRKRERLH
ncbi:MAG: DEAD/DEAH box helicase [Fibrobacterales bacterium]